MFKRWKTRRAGSTWQQLCRDVHDLAAWDEDDVVTVLQAHEAMDVPMDLAVRNALVAARSGMTAKELIDFMAQAKAAVDAGRSSGVAVTDFAVVGWSVTKS